MTRLETAQLQELHHVLVQEVEQIQHAVTALHEKKSALVASKPQLLMQIDRQLMAINRKTKQLNEQRQQIMVDLGLPEARLNGLIDALEPGEAQRFRLIQQELLGSVELMGRLNQESQSLLDLSLAWLQETVEIIASAITPEGASYDAQGAKTKGKKATPPPMQSTVNHSV